MDPHRKRKIRLFAALTAALLLAGALAYTSFSAANEARQPSQLLNANPDRTYDLTGKVAAGSVRRHGEKLDFRVSDRDGSTAIPVRYAGTIPDPFREGREVVLTGKVVNGVFIGERDTLSTKCPSKFSEGKNQ
jgi:cytochrome c-type biogenesis protein CcmE